MHPTTRSRVGGIFLYVVLVFVGVMFGASVYQRISIIPEWGGDLPQSVVSYFCGTNSGAAMDRFWTSVTAPTALVIILALILNWRLPARPRWISIGAVLFFVMLAWTALYFIPKDLLGLVSRGGDARGVCLFHQSCYSRERLGPVLGWVS